MTIDTTMEAAERRELFVPNAVARLEKREEGDAEMITGYAAVFYRADDPGTEFELFPGFAERIMPGAFDRAIREGDDVIAVVNHDRNRLLGRTASGTLRLSVDNIGLRYEVDPPNTPLGAEVREWIRRGDISGSSFLFFVTDEEFVMENKREIRLVKGVDLRDVGPVVRPAYSGANVTVAKRSLEEWRASRPKPNMKRAQEYLKNRA